MVDRVLAVLVKHSPFFLVFYLEKLEKQFQDNKNAEKTNKEETETGREEIDQKRNENLTIEKREVSYQSGHIRHGKSHSLQ